MPYVVLRLWGLPGADKRQRGERTDADLTKKHTVFNKQYMFYYFD